MFFSKKCSGKKIKLVALLVAFVMMMGFMPKTAFTAFAAAPASYTNIAPNSSVTVSIGYSGDAKYYRFVPSESGTVTFYSSNYSGDPKVALLDSTGTQLDSNDDGVNGLNFSLSYYCVANTTYYIKAHMYNTNTGSYTLHVDGGGNAVNPNPNAPAGNSVQINQTGSFALFNSGSASSTGSYYSDTANYDEASYNNGGYDLYANQGDANEVIQLGLPFTVGIILNEHATINIYAFDVDEYDQYHGHSGDERDYVYLVDESTGARTKIDGHLSGQNQTWNTTALTIAPNLFIVGHTYHFELDVDCTCNSCSYWVVYVRTVSLIVNGDAPVQNQTGIESADLSAQISSTGLVSVDLTAKAYAEQDYTLEFKAVYLSNGAQYGGAEYDVVIGTQFVDFSSSFQLEADAIRGTYEISVFIKDGLGNLIATRTATASYGYSAVSYNPNGGSQNIPTDAIAYSDGDTVVVKFDRIPSRYGYVFLGWSTDRYAVEPTYTEQGANVFTIGGSDVTLYAVWGIESVPDVPGVLNQGKILLIEDNLPWGNSANADLLNNLLNNEKITDWDKISTNQATLDCLKEYSVVLTANQQNDSQSFNNLKDVFNEYVSLGGILVYGACTSSGTALLPDGVQAIHVSSNNNYIVDNSNPIITREYSENSVMVDSDFVGSACNHNYLTGLPANSNVILRDASGRATLAEYSIGNGHVIASGLTWEFYYSDASSFANKAYDDLLLYALSLSGEIVEDDDDDDRVVDVWDGTMDTDWYDSARSEYTIYTAEELAGLAYLVNNRNSFSGKTIYLGNDIDLSGYNWTPIGDDGNNVFSGTFDGRYHVITGLSLEKSANHSGCGIGLFGTIESATLRNLGVEDAEVVVYGGRSGIICGVQKSNSLIENCYTTGSITITGIASGGGNCVGGFVGDMQGGEIRIRNCYSSSDVSSRISDEDLHVSGFVGFVCGASNSNIKYIENCYSSGVVETPSGAKGGLVGQLYYGTLYVSNCFSDATLSGGYAGMIIGSTDTSIQYSIDNTYYSNAGSSYIGGTATSSQNFQSQSWIDANLGWDFNTVWKFDGSGDYPVLQGFDGGNYQPHTHEFSEAYRTEATCTVDGRIVYGCSCGEERYEIIRAYGHDIETVIETEVTCETDGLIVDRCTNDGCDYEKRTIIHGEHNFSITDRQEATCEVNGYIEYTCSNCGEKNYEEIEGRHNYVESSREEPQVDVEGSITYTCTICNDSYDVIIPALMPVLKNSAVLLIQDSLPWAENVNTELLEELMERGVVSQYNIINTSALSSYDLSQYGVVFIANDQSTSMYNRLAENADKLENYVMAGGNLIYGACDQGWGGSGTLSHALPGGVTTSNYYSVHNYIVNDLHPIVTGVYTDNRNLRDELLKGNYCSHTYFDTATLVDGTDVILRDANGNPTLIEYNLGEGTIIATGLTWEYFYVRNHYDMLTNYSKYAYDDLVTYMVYMSNTCEHSYEVVETIEATCEENGYTKYVCTLCSYEYMADVVIAPGHIHEESDRTDATCSSLGEIVYTCHCGDVKTEVIDYLDHTTSDWIIDEEPTNWQDGAKHKECTVCGEILESESIPSLFLLGDVNDDGFVDVADVVTIRRYLVGDAGITIESLQADMDENGEINIKDVILLRRYLVDGQI